MERLVPRVHRVPLVRLGHWDHRVILVSRDTLETQDTVEPSVLLALLEQLESREPLESLDHVEHPVIQARKDHKVTPDLLVSQVRLEVQVHKELQGNKEQLEALGLWVQMVMWELRVLLARLEMLDKLAVKVKQTCITYLLNYFNFSAFQFINVVA